MFLNKEPKRGILIYCREGIDVQLLDTIQYTLFENLCIKIKIDNNDLFLGCIYRSPSSDKLDSTIQINNFLKSIDINNYQQFYLTGDFNYPEIVWPDRLSLKPSEELFVDCIDSLFLNQVITKPTRNVCGQKSNILDLVFTNDITNINNIHHMAPLGSSDHNIIILELNMPLLTDKPTEPKLNFFKTDFSSFKKYLSNKDWSSLSNLSANDAWDNLSAILKEGFKNFVPKTKNRKNNQPFWLNNQCNKAIKKKYLYYKRFMQSHSSYDYNQYIKKRNKAKKVIRESVRNHEKKIVNESKHNSKPFWKYVNKLLKRSTGVANLIKPDKSFTKNDNEKANVLNDFFSSVFTKEDINNIPKIENKSKNNFLSDIILTKESVKNKLKNLKTNKAMGPDGIPAIILKELCEELCLPLSIIFNKSISTGEVPKEWKVAEVTAIFKKGNKQEPGNYRPVSLTSISCKILESIVTDSIRNYMETNSLFTKCQHGFRNNRSCVTQLLEVLNNFSSMIENKDCIDVIYLDFSKAFDTVPHQRLITKLKSYGIDGNILNWIADFLSNRSQRVRVNQSHSDFKPVTSGIPQGSILGPLLFIIFINDLPEGLSSLCEIFADDTKLFNSHKKSKIMQQDLLTLTKWSNVWQINFNISKCSVLHIGVKNEKHKYYLDKDMLKELKTTEHEKDVGVIFSPNLKFDEHINTIINKANQLIGLIKRSFTHIDQNFLIKLYKSIVRPHLEYANVIWHPMYKRQLKLIEKVQRRFTKIIPNFKDLTYNERLKRLRLPSIKYRQIRADLIQTYKIIHRIDNLTCSDFFNFSNNQTRNSKLKLFKEQATTNVRRNFLTNRVNNYWNSLSELTRDASNINEFKNGIDRELANIMFDYEE